MAISSLVRSEPSNYNSRTDSKLTSTIFIYQFSSSHAAFCLRLLSSAHIRPSDRSCPPMIVQATALVRPCHVRTSHRPRPPMSIQASAPSVEEAAPVCPSDHSCLFLQSPLAVHATALLRPGPCKRPPLSGPCKRLPLSVPSTTPFRSSHYPQCPRVSLCP